MYVWYFNGLSFDSLTSAPKIKDINIDWQNQSTTRIKCVQNAALVNSFAIKYKLISNLAVEVENYFWNKMESPLELAVGQNYTFEIIQTNTLSYQWDLGTEGGIETTKVIMYTPKSIGLKNICVDVTVFGGAKMSRCFQFSVRNSDGNSNTGK